MILKGLALVLALTFATPAQTTGLTVVSAASYQKTVAPDSLASIFGTTGAHDTLSATLDASGQLPTELAAIRVEVNGQQASLIYVSPTQINFVMPAGIAAGTTTVLVRSTDTGATSSAAVTIVASAPAIFTSDGSGIDPGAILNAVTYRPAPFLVATPENGADTRTRLAVYGTGFRHAKMVTAVATDPSGNHNNLTVEFAGAAPGFFGLDQLNFIVPAPLDGTGTVSLVITSEDAASNTVTFQMSLLPPSALKLAGVVIAPHFVNGGDSMTATASLNGVARAGGFALGLRTTNPVAQVTPVVTIPEGKASVDTMVTTNSTDTVQTGSIVAESAGAAFAANFEVDPATQLQLSSLTITPASGPGGRNIQGTVVLTGTATVSGITVQLASDTAAVRPPATVTVPIGQNSVNFTIATTAVSSQLNANVTATLGRTTVTGMVTLLPAILLSIDRTTVSGGSPAMGTITLADAAPATGAQVTLTSSVPSAASVPPFTSILSGQTTGTFSITTFPFTTARTVTISASYLGVTQSASLTVNPAGAATLSSLSLSPDHVKGGTPAQGTVTLTAAAPAGGVQVRLLGSLPSAQFPAGAFVVVPQDQLSATFTINTTPVPSAQAVTITATAGTVSKTATLTVQ